MKSLFKKDWTLLIGLIKGVMAVVIMLSESPRVIDTVFQYPRF